MGHFVPIQTTGTIFNTGDFQFLEATRKIFPFGPGKLFQRNEGLLLSGPFFLGNLHPIGLQLTEVFLFLKARTRLVFQTFRT